MFVTICFLFPLHVGMIRRKVHTNESLDFSIDRQTDTLFCPKSNACLLSTANECWSMKRLYVGGLSHTISQKDLRDRFGKFGEVSDVEIITRTDENGESLTKAFWWSTYLYSYIYIYIFIFWFVCFRISSEDLRLCEYKYLWLRLQKMYVCGIKLNYLAKMYLVHAVALF